MLRCSLLCDGGSRQHCGGESGAGHGGGSGKSPLPGHRSLCGLGDRGEHSHGVHKLPPPGLPRVLQRLPGCSLWRPGLQGPGKRLLSKTFISILIISRVATRTGSGRSATCTMSWGRWGERGRGLWGVVFWAKCPKVKRGDSADCR